MSAGFSTGGAVRYVYFLTVSAKNPTRVLFLILPLRVFACERDFLNNFTINRVNAAADATKIIARELHSKFFESIRFFPLIVCEFFDKKKTLIKMLTLQFTARRSLIFIRPQIKQLLRVYILNFSNLWYFEGSASLLPTVLLLLVAAV